MNLSPEEAPIKVLDSCVIIDYLKGRERARDKIFDIPQDRRFITSLVLYEVFRGRKGKVKIENIERAIKETGLHLLEGDEVMELAISLIKGRYAYQGKKMGDALIAATCIVRDAVVLTKNKKDFKHIGNLKLEMM